MAAPKGNKYYLLAEKPAGRPKLFKTPDDMWSAFLEYKKHNSENPFYKYEAIKSGKDTGKLVAIPVEKPLTWHGFAIYIGTWPQVLSNYKVAYQEFSEVFTRIDAECYEHKYSGAAANIFNATIIARDLGLKDQTDINVNGKVNIKPKQWTE